MKRLRILCVALAALFLISCGKEIVEVPIVEPTQEEIQIVKEYVVSDELKELQKTMEEKIRINRLANVEKETKLKPKKVVKKTTTKKKVTYTKKNRARTGAANNVYNLSSEEIRWFRAALAAEVGYGLKNFDNIWSTGSVFINRLEDARFPSNMISLIKQPKQFEVYANGRMWRSYPNTKEFQKAVRLLLEGKIHPKLSRNTLYFTMYTHTKGFSKWSIRRCRIGDHVFFDGK